MNKITTALGLLLLMFLIAACTEDDAEASAKPKNPGFIKIGEKLEIAYIQHIEGKEYQIAYTKENNELIWETIGDHKSQAKVFVKEGIETPYLEREKDIGESIFALPLYTLYIPKHQEIKGGTITRGGKTSVSIPTSMIY